MPETVFMFSGQGSQYFHMGRSLYDGNPAFRSWMLRLDEMARAAGAPVLDTLYADSNTKGQPFDRTLFTHPAIFMVEYSLAQALMESGVRPDLVLGVSVGSFAAAAVAGFVDVEDALKAVIRQAMAVEEASEPGGMIAILADPVLFAEEFLRGHSELAGVNFSTHFVVSAKRSELAPIESTLKQRNVTHQRLPVVVPFHSKWIDDARVPFETYMRSVSYKPARLPMACSDRTEVMSELSTGYFWDVVRNPIRFRETAARLEEQASRRWVDVGPGGTLATFLKYGLPPGPKSTVHSILTPFGTDQKNFAALTAAGH
ncbi:MAG TPA: acyltransferase domain-containing protein [Thermoanaerobaculia bacterium]